MNILKWTFSLVSEFDTKGKSMICLVSKSDFCTGERYEPATSIGPMSSRMHRLLCHQGLMLDLVKDYISWAQMKTCAIKWGMLFSWSLPF